jgi:leader peptidase (prepilin peptidase) / N-methyltransferase
VTVTTTDLQAHLPFGLAVALAAVIGLLVGSFLNVVVYRTPRHISVSSPRSFCPTCDRQLAAWENVPVVSWLVLRGRCHSCGEPISIRYPLVEAGTAVSFALVTVAWHGRAPAIGYCILAATLLAITLIDIGGLRAPLAVAAMGTAAGDLALIAATLWSHNWATLTGAQLGLVAGASIFAVLRHGDPECTWPQQYGRSALVPLGCWLGGLGALPAAVGLAVGGGSFLLCLTLAARRHRTRPGGAPGTTRSPDARGLGLLVERPLVMAVAVAAVGGLLAFW